MRTIHTEDLGTLNLTAEDNLWVYNGLDCCITLEVLQKIKPQLDEHTQKIYDLERALQKPSLGMTWRGILVDRPRIVEGIERLKKTRARILSNFQRITLEVYGKAINPASPLQLKELFYETLQLPEQRFRGKVTTSRDALEKLRVHFHAQPLINHILEIRDIDKQLAVLRTGVDPDGRIRASFSIAGTETGRFASYGNPFGRGTNLQNIPESLRYIFVADKGYKMAYIDLEQAESRVVGAIVYSLFNDSTYLDACEAGDLHTTVTRLIWPNLPWTGDAKEDRKIANQNFYRSYSYRDMSKRGGHGTNYYGTPPTMARHLKVPVKLMADFQRAYFNAFPGIRKWHHHTAGELMREGHIITLLGRKRWFFGRRNDDATLREAIAYNPQSTIADGLNTSMLALWHTFPEVHLLAQVHDAVLVQYPEENEDEIIPKLRDILTTRIDLGGYGDIPKRQLTIPTEAMTGWNWGKGSDENPDGLKVFNSHDPRERRHFSGGTALSAILNAPI